MKAISWRTLGSIDTFVLGLIFTSSIQTAGSIALTEVFTKILLYYGHERAWAAILWGSAVTAPETTEPPREVAAVLGAPAETGA